MYLIGLIVKDRSFLEHNFPFNYLCLTLDDDRIERPKKSCCVCVDRVANDELG